MREGGGGDDGDGRGQWLDEQHPGVARQARREAN